MRSIALIVAMCMAAITLMACSTQAAAVGGTRVDVPGGSYTNVTPAQLKEMLEQKDFFLVDVHVPYAGELPRTDTFIPYTDIEQNLPKLPADKNAKIVLYCSSGHMSGIAANTLVKLGYMNIWNLEGGMAGWQSVGYPLIQNKQ